jgi:8-oxo-dGTP diphosphatase
MKQQFPMVMADVALFAVLNQQLRVLVVERSNAPHARRWAFPGGILKPDTDRNLDDTARRVLLDKTHVDAPHLEQVATFSGPDRDPRGWSVSTLYYGLLPHDRVPAVAGHKTEAVAWCNAHQPEHRLAFDHDLLLDTAVGKLRNKIERNALPLHLLPEKFTLTELQQACEAILGKSLDKSVFRRRLKDDPRMVPLPGEFLLGSQRPAQLYRSAPDFSF